MQKKLLRQGRKAQMLWHARQSLKNCLQEWAPGPDVQGMSALCLGGLGHQSCPTVWLIQRRKTNGNLTTSYSMMSCGHGTTTDDRPQGPLEINEGQWSAADQHRLRQKTCQNANIRSPRSTASRAGGKENVPSRFM